MAVVPGQVVAAGEDLAILEAMKMRNVLKAEAAGVVSEVLAKPGQVVAVDAVLLRFK